MKIVIATCASHRVLPPGDQLLAAALRQHGATVDVQTWDAIEPTGSPDVVICLRSTWDYHERWGEFSGWLQRCAAAGQRLINPLTTVLWNVDKIYLQQLAAAGVPIPPVHWFAPGDRVDAATVAAALATLGVTDGVLKPRVSASAHGTERVGPGRTPSPGACEVAATVGGMVQAYVPEIATAGELSLMFFGGRFSHAVRKTTAPGDFRVQVEHGGQYAPVDPSPGLVRAATAMLDAVSPPWTFARVDLVDTAAGPLLMELELIEPELFLTPTVAEMLATQLLHDAAEAAAC